MEPSPRPPTKIPRRVFLKRSLVVGTGVLGASAAVLALASNGPPAAQPSPNPLPGSPSREPLSDDALVEQIVSGGPPPDGIPSIDAPGFIEVAEADRQWAAEDLVDGIEFGDRPRAYPRLITVWHEIVNHAFGGETIALTYCPLTGSTLVFGARAASNGHDATFGTSGRLLNSNLVMYDRATESLWPQLLGRAVSGPRKGQRLELRPVVTTTWERWRSHHPDTLVLSVETGFARAYGTSPYGDYDNVDAIFFPVRPQDSRFKPKKVMISVLDPEPVGFGHDELRQTSVLHAEVAETTLAALYDAKLDEGRVFRLDRGERLRVVEPGRRYATSEGTEYDEVGRAGPGGQSLEQVPSFHVHWFAWYADHPSGRVVA